MKKFKLLVLALTLSLSGLAYSAFAISAMANLECSDLTGCSGSANCGGPGYESSICVIECQGGGQIKCGGSGGDEEIQ